MSLKEAFCSYYGWIYPDRKPVRTLAQDLIKQRNDEMLDELKSMEERIKRHITECKREVIKELNKSHMEINKEKVNGSKSGSKSKKSG